MYVSTVTDVFSSVVDNESNRICFFFFFFCQPSFRFRTDNAYMTDGELARKRTAQEEMQEALRAQIEEKKRAKDAQRRKEEEEDLREQQRFEREAAAQAEKERRELDAERKKKAGDENQKIVEAAWVAASASKPKRGHHHTRASRDDGPPFGPPPGLRDDGPASPTSPPRGGGTAGAPPPPLSSSRPTSAHPPPLADRLHNAGSRPESQGLPGASSFQSAPVGHGYSMGVGAGSAGLLRPEGPGPRTQEAIIESSRRAQEEAKHEVERLRLDLERQLRSAVQRQEMEMAELRQRALKAELDAERGRTELAELQLQVDHTGRAMDNPLDAFLANEVWRGRPPSALAPMPFDPTASMAHETAFMPLRGGGPVRGSTVLRSSRDGDALEELLRANIGTAGEGGRERRTPSGSRSSNSRPRSGRYHAVETPGGGLARVAASQPQAREGTPPELTSIYMKNQAKSQALDLLARDLGKASLEEDVGGRGEGARGGAPNMEEVDRFLQEFVRPVQAKSRPVSGVGGGGSRPMSGMKTLPGESSFLPGPS